MYINLPPRLDEPLSPANRPSGADTTSQSKWRRVAMLAVLSGYILAVVFRRGDAAPAGPALPGTTAALMRGMVPELAVFAAVIGLAWWIGRPTRRELFADHGPTFGRWIFGFGWSLALRFGLGGVVAMVAVLIESLKGKSGPHTFEAYRPKVENLVDFRALQDPIYLFAICTVVSFGLAGLREELWRAGMICAGAGLLPWAWSPLRRQWIAMIFAALIFGAAHGLQGAAGVVLAGLLGLFLGMIMVLRRSLWEAVLAHGFFDAGSFVLLRIFSDRQLLEKLLQRAGLPSELIQNLLDQLSQYFGK